MKRLLVGIMHMQGKKLNRICVSLNGDVNQGVLIRMNIFSVNFLFAKNIRESAEAVLGALWLAHDLPVPLPYLDV